MIGHEKIDRLQELIDEYWGDAMKKTFTEHSKELLGDDEMLRLTASAVHALIMQDPMGVNDGPNAVVSLLVGVLKRAHSIGKESMLQ